LTLVCALSLAASSADAAWAKSNKGGPEVKWSAPSAFVTGQSFKVSLEIVAPEGGTTVANWLVSPAAFTLDGKPLAKREEGGTFNLPAGFKLTGDIDLGPYIKNTANFKLGYANEASDAPPVEVKVLEAAPAGLNFMQMPLEDLSKYQVILRTVRGDITVKFWPDVAPNHVRNFLDLSYTGFYKGTTFHRVIPGFMIQGGDPTGTGTGSGPRQLQSEFQAQKKHLRGVLSMARSSDPNSASCQFFIMHAAAPSLDNQYSAFGEVVTGMDAVDKIVNTPRGGNDKPKEPQTILEALVVRTQG
jgi:peptidyl-prolyl cis-trans isomerase B (cyclophilin B)